MTRTADIETTVLILVLGVAVNELAAWGRRQNLADSRRSAYLQGINAAAQAVAADGSAVALIDQISGQTWDVEHDGLPADTELLVENHGVFHGLFLMAAVPRSRPHSSNGWSQ
jgi:hypothetical protein